jgi:hypothetical protein
MLASAFGILTALVLFACISAWLAKGRVAGLWFSYEYAFYAFQSWWEEGHHLTPAAGDWIGVVGFMGIFVFIAVICGWDLGFETGRRQLSGREFVAPKELYLKPRNSFQAGISVGGATLTKRDEANGCLIVAGSGGGKTVFLLDIIQQVWRRGERAIILDSKRDLLPVIPKPGPGEERRVVNFAYWDQGSYVWATGRDIADETTAARFSTSITSQISTELVKGGDFWIEGAEVLVRTAVLACVAAGPEWTITDFYVTLMTILRLPWRKIRAVVAEFFPLGETIISDQAEEMAAGFLANVTTALKPIDLLAKWQTAQGKTAPRYSITEFLEGQDFLVVSSACVNKPAGRVFANAFLDLAIERLLAQPDASGPGDAKAATWFILDEIGDAGRIEGLESGIVKLRSKGGRAFLAIQSVAQIQQTYSQNTAQVWRGSLQTLILSHQRGGGKDGDEKWAEDQVGEAVWELYEPPQNPGAFGTFVKKTMPLVRGADFSRMGLVTDKHGCELGIRSVAVAGHNVTELWQPIVNYRRYRPLPARIILATPASIYGRIAARVAKKADEAKQELAAALAARRAEAAAKAVRQEEVGRLSAETSRITTVRAAALAQQPQPSAGNEFEPPELFNDEDIPSSQHRTKR